MSDDDRMPPMQNMLSMCNLQMCADSQEMKIRREKKRERIKKAYEWKLGESGKERY